MAKIGSLVPFISWGQKSKIRKEQGRNGRGMGVLIGLWGGGRVEADGWARAVSMHGNVYLLLILLLTLKIQNLSIK